MFGFDNKDDICDLAKKVHGHHAICSTIPPFCMQVCVKRNIFEQCFKMADDQRVSKQSLILTDQLYHLWKNELVHVKKKSLLWPSNI